MTDLVRAAEYHLGLNNAEYLRDAQQVDAANQKMASGFDQLAVEEARVTQTTQVMGNEFERLEGRYDRLIQIETRRRNALEQSQRIAAEEGISAERLGAQIARVNAKFDDQVAALSRVRGPLQQATATSRGFGSAIQQAGFQVGDFAVQVASGQGVLRPLIQQGTQLISMFGPWGAVLGAAGAIVGALAVSFMDLDDATEDAEAAQDSYNKMMERATAITKQFREEIRMTAEARAAESRFVVRDMETRLTERQAALSDMQRQIDEAAAEFMGRGMERGPAAQMAEDTLFGGGSAITGESGQSMFAREKDAVRDLRAEILSLRAEYGEFDKFNGPEMMRTRLTGDPYSPSNDNKSPASSKRVAETKAIEEQRSALDALVATAKNENDLLRLTGSARTALERTRTADAAVMQAQSAALKDYNAGLRDTALLTQEEVVNVRELTMANYDLSAAQTERGVKAVKINEEISESTRMLEGFLDQSFDRIGGGITEALATGQIEMAKLGDIGRAVVSELMQLFMQLAITNPLKNLALGQDNPVLSDVFGSLVSGIGSWFGGGLMADPNGAMLGRASGGRVKAGGAYWVGESGPEPFYPDQNGVIEPNWSAMRGANANAAPVNVTVIDQRKSGEAVETQSQRRADGGTDIRIIVRDMMRKEISDGAFDRQLATRYGSTLQPA